MKTTLFIALAALLLLAACGSGGPQVNNAVPFIGGNVGLDVALVEGMPPAAIYDNNKMTFGVGIALHNVGEADIGPETNNDYVQVSLGGIRPGAFGLEPAELSQGIEEPLLGSHKNFDGTILPGQIRPVIFEDLNYQERLQGNTLQNFIVKACYDYETFATAPICFKDDILESAQDAQICTLTGEKQPQNSGGPLHVTSLVQNPLSAHKVMVNFIVEHTGTGQFYGRRNGADPETCDESVTNMNKYRVDVNVSSQDSGMQIHCSTLGGGASGTITLFSGAPMTVTCTLTGAADQNTRIYTEPLVINLRYRYGESIMQSVLIQAVGNS